jgi:transposase InsO family protein
VAQGPAAAGAKKIRSMLAREGYPVPAVSTVHQVLVRRGLVDRAAPSREPPGGWQRFTRPSCNDLWHIDATRHALAGGRGFWVLDLVDDHSRFLVAAHVAAGPTMEAGWAAFRGAAAACGLPRQLLSDNGLNFTGRFHGMSVAFERQVTAAGTQLIHSRARHPQTPGKLERQHATQNDWITDHRRPRSLAAAQKVLDACRQDYNTARPHEAIGQQFPAECYLPDPGITLPVIELAPADPYPPGCLMRKVRASGDFRYATACLPIDARWAGIQVSLIREHGRLLVYYGAALLERAGVRVGPPARQIPRSHPAMRTHQRRLGQRGLGVVWCGCWISLPGPCHVAPHLPGTLGQVSVRLKYETFTSVRLKSGDGRWRVDLIRHTATSDHRDGEWLRVHRDGFFVAEVRTVAELGDYVDVAELEEALFLFRNSSACARGVVTLLPGRAECYASPAGSPSSRLWTPTAPRGARMSLLKP